MDIGEWKRLARSRLESGTMNDAEWESVCSALLVVSEGEGIELFDEAINEEWNVAHPCKRTSRGFQIITFDDANGKECELQQSSAIDDTERGLNEPGSSYVKTDDDRLRYLAGCGHDDGPIIEGFGNVLDDWWTYLGDVCRDRVGDDAYAADDFEASDDDKVEAFRRMVDAAIESK